MCPNRFKSIELFLPKSRDVRAGFVMIEVIVGIVITALFIGISMQFMVLSSLLKGRSQQYSEAMTWIQENLEDIKYQASKYKLSSLSSTAAVVNSSTISLSSAQDFEVNDRIKVGTDTTTYTISSISVNTLTISPNVAVASLASSPVVVTKSIRCNRVATPVTITTGFADGFRDRLIGSPLAVTSSNTDITKTSTKSGKPYRLRRTISLVNVDPYNTIKIDYQVSEAYGDGSFGVLIADTYAEVVPPTSFSCPQ